MLTLSLPPDALAESLPVDLASIPNCPTALPVIILTRYFDGNALMPFHAALSMSIDEEPVSIICRNLEIDGTCYTNRYFSRECSSEVAAEILKDDGSILSEMTRYP